MKFNEWINYVKSVGGVDTDGYYGKQCMDLYNHYCTNVLNLTEKSTGADFARNIINNAYVMANVERIDNYAEFIPQKGDIAVWQGGQYGHVAICLGNGDLNAFNSIEQNWIPQKLSEEWHNYEYMKPLIFLRPKNQSNIKDEQIEDKKTMNQLAQECIAGKYGNGQERKNNIEAMGYNYTEVQAEVNRLMTPQKSFDEVVNGCIRGEYGNGQERIKKVTAEGYDYNKVQAEVNRRI